MVAQSRLAWQASAILINLESHFGGLKIQGQMDKEYLPMITIMNYKDLFTLITCQVL